MAKIFKSITAEGFTLTELMLAMVLFTTVLVLSTVGFIGMNRTFSRGTIKKQLSEGVQAFSEDVTRTLRAQPTNALPGKCDGVDNNCKNKVKPDWQWLSFANACYLWQSPTVENYEAGLYKKSGPCTNTSLDDKITVLSTRYVVRVAPEVKLIEGDTDGSQLYSVSGVFTTPEDDAIHVKDTSTDPNDNWRCKGTTESENVATCAVEEFNFVVNPRGNSI